MQNRNAFLFTLFKFMVLLFLQAEGTFEFRRGAVNPASPTHDVFVESPGWNTSTGNPVNPASDIGQRITFFKVDIRSSTEVIDIYTSVYDNPAVIGGRQYGDIGVWNPGASPGASSWPDFAYDVTGTTSNGYIGSWNDVRNVQSIATRPRPPITFTPSTAGVYTVRLFGKRNTNGIDGGTSTPNGIQHFDIMVRDTSTGILKKGRVWSDHYAISMNTGGRQLGAILYIVAGSDQGSWYEGHLWKMDANNMDPFGFHMYSNRYGAYPAQNHWKSVPNTLNPQMVFQYPVYFNPPEKSVIVPPGPWARNFTFLSECQGSTLKGGKFEFDTNGPWDYEIIIDENGDGVCHFATERTLRGTAIGGHNVVNWDGNKKDGTPLNSIGGVVEVRMRVKVGEVHFPFYDVENLNRGPKVTMQSGGGAISSKYFWDDQLVGFNTSGAGGADDNRTIAGSTTDGNNRLMDTWKFAEVADDQKVFTYSCAGGVNVSGMVYNDANHNSYLDNDEYTSGLVLYAKLVKSSTPSGPATHVTAVAVGTGTYSFSGVAADTYDIVIDTNNDSNDVVPNLPAGWIPTEVTTMKRRTSVPSSDNVNDQNFGIYYGSKITGTVFLDTGAGGGVPNNGVKDGDEGGIYQVTVTAIDTADTLYDTTQTSADGSYTIFIPATATTVRIVEQNLPAYVSVSGAPGNTGGSYDRTGDHTQFSNTVGTVYSGVDFGDVRAIRFSSDNQQTTAPGSVVFYKHFFTAGTGGTVYFTTNNQPTPALPGWKHVVYHDVEGNGTIDPTDYPLLPSTVLPVSAEEKVCLIVREAVPPGAPDKARDILTITPHFTYVNANPPLSSSAPANVDVTLVDTSQGNLRLIKSVDKESARPGDVLTYTILYINMGSQHVKEIVLSDPISPYCELVLGEFPESKDILWQKPDGSTVYLTAAIDGDEGSYENTLLYVRMGSSLEVHPGDSGMVQYMVRVR